MAFMCSICAEESTRICVRCTKDSCDNHLCEKCHCCSDCCECEVTLEENHYGLMAGAVHPHTLHEPQIPAVEGPSPEIFALEPEPSAQDAPAELFVPEAAEDILVTEAAAEHPVPEAAAEPSIPQPPAEPPVPQSAAEPSGENPADESASGDITTDTPR